MRRNNLSLSNAPQNTASNQPSTKKRRTHEPKGEQSKSLDEEISEAIKNKLFDDNQLKRLEELRRLIEEEKKMEKEVDDRSEKLKRDHKACEKREEFIRQGENVIKIELENTKNDIEKLREKNKYLMGRVSKTMAQKSVGTPVITLNVGGELVTTTLSTLKTPFFDILHCNPQGVPRDEKGNIYIDRSPALFKLFLDCLRAGEISPDLHKELTPRMHDALFAEASYFGAYSLVEGFRGISVPMGLSPSASVELCKKCKCDVFQLVYKASRDGFSAKNFHDKCNGLFPSLVIVHSTNGSIFGCYFEVPWESPAESGYVKGTGNEFMFTLVNQKCDEPIFFDSAIIPYVYQSRFNGPAIGMSGKEFSFFISDKPNENRFSNVKGFSENGVFNTRGYSSVVFNGSDTFSVLDYEVYLIPKWSNMSSSPK